VWQLTGRRRTRAEREDGANRLVVLGIAGLLAVTLVAMVALASQPASRSTPPRIASTKAASSPSPSPAAAPPQPAVVVPTPQPSVPPAPQPTVAPIAQPAAAPPAPAAPVTPLSPAARRPAGPSTVPNRMQHLLPGSSQIIIVTGAKVGSNAGNLTLYDRVKGSWVKVLSTPAAFGKTGLTNGKNRKSGHLDTPTGIWSIGAFLFGQHGSAPTGTRMPYRHITNRSWWSARRDSTYNTWVESVAPVSGEHLADAKVQYEYAFNSGYNAPPNQRVIGRGSAIFIHCSEPPGNALGKFTHGCIAIPRTEMVKLFRLLDPKRRPSCAIGTTAKGGSTSIYTY
jgi:L,D-peptidoglycan transpeptidase YkuD (ErfK/YbiS/YcfS/YnhG family)